MPTPDDLSEAENERIFLEDILPDYICRCPPPRAIRRPQGIIMGGQMGSGKSRLSGRLQKSTTPRAIPIESDELREHHPLYQSLKIKDPAYAVACSKTDAGKWTEKLINALVPRRMHLLVEGTMGRFEPFQKTAQVFKRHGYFVRAELLAVDERISWQATIQRAEEMAATGQGMRTVLRTAHDEAAAGVLATVDSISVSGLADRICVHARDGRVLLDMAAIQGRFPEPGAVRHTIQFERNRPWSEAEKESHDARWVRILDLMERRGASDPEIERVAEMRQVDADVLGYAIPGDDHGYGN